VDFFIQHFCASAGYSASLANLSETILSDGELAGSGLKIAAATLAYRSRSSSRMTRSCTGKR